MTATFVYDAVRTPFGRYGKGARRACGPTTSPPS